MTEKEREKVIVKTGGIGIITNLFLAGFKASAGLVAGSIAIVLDAVNNLSDALSSVITIIGTKLAMKPADRKHPLGHGRGEYLTTMLISVIILIAGATSLIEAAKKIIHPSDPDYTAVTLIIIIVAILTKIVLGLYTRGKGEAANADTLKASGADALFDAILSAGTLVSALISLFLGLNLDGWIGALISVVIIKAGVEMLLDTISDLLGRRVDPALVRGVRETISSFPEVLGVYDLYMDSYGPNRMTGSAHVELDDTITAREIDTLSRRITSAVYDKHKIGLTIGIYASDITNPEVVALRKDIEKICLSHPGVLQIHGFRVDADHKSVVFDVVRDFDGEDAGTLIRELNREITEAHPEYTYLIVPDVDYTLTDLE